MINFIGFGRQRCLWALGPLTWSDVGIVSSSLAETPSVVMAGITTGKCHLKSAPCADYDGPGRESGGCTLILRLLHILKLLTRFSTFLMHQNLKQILAIIKIQDCQLGVFSNTPNPCLDQYLSHPRQQYNGWAGNTALEPR